MEDLFIGNSSDPICGRLCERARSRYSRNGVIIGSKPTIGTCILSQERLDKRRKRPTVKKRVVPGQISFVKIDKSGVPYL